MVMGCASAAGSSTAETTAVSASASATSAITAVALSPEELAKELQRCFEQQLKASGPSVGFRGTLELALLPDGAVRSARLGEDPPQPLATCVEAAAMRARFAPPKAGETAIAMPLNFTVR